MSNQTGTVITVKDYIIEVEFLGDPKPEINQLLSKAGDPEVKLQVFKSAGKDRFYCIGLAKHERLVRGSEVDNTGSFLEIPVGEALLGRVVNLFGEPVDGKGPVSTTESRPIFPKKGESEAAPLPTIKAIPEP